MTLELLVDGVRYSGWTSIEVVRAVEQAASSFSLGLTERWPGRDEPWLIGVEAECQILTDGERLITGYTDTFSVSIDASDHSIATTGRARTGDLIDCSADIKGGQFRGRTAAEIIASLCAPFGIEVISEIPAEPVTDLQIQQGETVFEIIQRLCRLQAFLASDTPDGRLRLYRVGVDRAHDALVEGQNILAASVEHDAARIHSEYRVKGQQPWVPGLGVEDITGSDASVIAARPMRYRPLVVVSEGQAHSGWARKRAHWEARRRAARAFSAEVLVRGWRQSNGALWRENVRVAITSKALGLDGEMLIAEVGYNLSGGGEITRLRLTHPDAYDPEPVKPRPATRKRKTGKNGANAKAIDWTQYFDKEGAQ